MNRFRHKKVSIYLCFVSIIFFLCYPHTLFPASKDQPDKTMTLAGLGDCIIARKVSQLHDPDFIKLVKLIRQVDCTWGNCEVPLVDPDNPYAYPQDRDDFIIACKPWGADEFKWLGIDLMGLANNHTTDFGYAGLFSTIENLERVGIGYAGVGKNLEEATRPRYIDTAAGRVGQVSCAFWFPKGSNASMPHPYLKGRPGLNPLRLEETFQLEPDSFNALEKIENDINSYFGGSPPDKPREKIKFGELNFVPGKKFEYRDILKESDMHRIIEAVKIARRNSRIVIVSIHQHMGFDESPSHCIEKFARNCIDAGADVIFGTGPHRLWGIEIYKNKPIFYSLGNFLFHGGSFGTYPTETYEMMGLPSDTRDISLIEEELLKKIPYFAKDFLFESIVPVITFSPANNVFSIKLYPIVFPKEAPYHQQGTPFLANKEKGKSIIEKLEKLSQQYKTKIDFKENYGIINRDSWE